MINKEKELYMASIAEKYSYKYMKKEADVIFFHVNHQLDDIIEFHNLVSDYFFKSFYIIIPYNISEITDIINEEIFCENYIKVYRESNRYYIYHNKNRICETGSELHVQMKDMFIISVQSIYNNLDVKKLLLLEDGGYHYSIFQEIIEKFPDLDNSIIGCVEQTRNGLRAYYSYIQSNTLNYPVIAIARSKIKMRIESYFIAKVAVELTNEFLNLLGEDLNAKDIIVIGYGAIGRNISNVLKLYSCERWIIEKDKKIRVLAKEEGEKCFESVSKEMFQSELVIIGTTGNASFSEEMLKEFFRSNIDNLTLVSISSKQTEFEKFFQCLQHYEYVVHEIYHKNYYLGKDYIFFMEGTKKYVRIFGNGYPINFFCTWKNGMPVSIIDMIYAEMIYSMKVILNECNSLENSLYLIGDTYPFFNNIEEEIFDEWMKRVQTIDEREKKDFLQVHPCEEYLRHSL